MSDLSAKSCIPCRGGVPPLAGDELERLHRELDRGWAVVDGHHLEKEFAFPDFRRALAFVNRVGEMCEEQGHHGDLLLRWGSVTLSVWTHKIDGLTESDFVWAAKAEALYEAD
jgi:4a-hydroxytetrahydrobiopterin dehydratase